MVLTQGKNLSCSVTVTEDGWYNVLASQHCYVPVAIQVKVACFFQPYSIKPNVTLVLWREKVNRRSLEHFLIAELPRFLDFKTHFFHILKFLKSRCVLHFMAFKNRCQAVQCLTTGWTIGRSRFDPRQEQIFLLAPASRPALGPTQPSIQWVPGVLSPGVKRGRDYNLFLPKQEQR
jgi:hypothetical protein